MYKSQASRRAILRYCSLLVVIGLLHTRSVMAEKGPTRVALVIGNAGYPDNALTNTINDADAVATALQEVGFRVTLLTDASKQKMEEGVERFVGELHGSAIGVFYYAGHGVQVDGENYLIPTDATAKDESDVKYRTVPAGWVVDKLAEAKNALNVIILDACRNNPFGRRWRSGSTGGLAPMQSGQGMLIAYSTAPGKVAADSGDNERNSPYTKNLVRYVREPGLSVEEVFKRTRQAVVEETSQRQVPWESSSLIGEFSFVPTGTSPVSTPRVNLPSPPAPAPQASLLATPTSKPQVDDSTREGAKKIGTASIMGPSQLWVGVMTPPAGDATILINDRDVSALLREEAANSAFTGYILEGSPDQLNLAVGRNKVVMRYGDTVLPAFDFKYTEKQKQEALEYQKKHGR